MNSKQLQLLCVVRFVIYFLVLRYNFSSYLCLRLKMEVLVYMFNNVSLTLFFTTSIHSVIVVSFVVAMEPCNYKYNLTYSKANTKHLNGRKCLYFVMWLLWQFLHMLDTSLLECFDTFHYFCCLSRYSNSPLKKLATTLARQSCRKIAISRQPYSPCLWAVCMSDISASVLSW